MGYQEELQARLSAVHRLTPEEPTQKLNTYSLEEKLTNEIAAEFELAQYDLDETDILRSIKILDILNTYTHAFSHPRSLAIFYALAKTDMIQPKNLLRLSGLSVQEFKNIIKAMAKEKLLSVNEDKELEITILGQSLAERIGFNVFI